MNNFYKLFFTVWTFIFFSQLSFGGSNSNWTVKFESQKVFIANKGQFQTKATPGFDSRVEYAYDGNGQNFYYFTKSGVIFQLEDTRKPVEDEKEKEKEDKEMRERIKKGKPMTSEEYMARENEERRMIVTKDVLQAQWIGANPNVQIIAEGQQSNYYSYSFRDQAGTMANESVIPAFTKLTYKDLYPNIDIVYEMHPDGGIKYSVIVHPGGDVSKVQLHYSKKTHLQANGDIKTKSKFGDFIDHAPSTFYEDGKTPIRSSYTLKNDLISFSIGSYDPTKTVVIDPWTQTPPLNTQWRCAWECERDAAGNAYMIGGQMPMQLLKYNSAGTLQWTYNTPYDTANFWLGTFAVDNAGNSYVAGGSPAAMVKVNTSGTVVWNNPSPGGLGTGNLLIEWWSISFNCDQTQLVVGGTAGTVSPLPEIYNIDLTSGNVISSAQATGGGIISPQEVRAITAAKNSKYYYLTHDSIGWIHQGLNSCVYPYYTNSGTSYAYNLSNFRSHNNGICAIKTLGDFVYVNRGDRIEKRAFNTAAVVATATIPGGAYTITLGSGQVSNSGIDIDSCGNIFVGSTTGVVKFNTNLTQLATYPTSFNVYDVAISPTGDLIAAGSTGTNTTNGARTGYIQSISVSACQTVVNICCDPAICPQPNVCISAAPFNLNALTGGGVWSGTGITNASTGTFSPAVAGIGTFTIYYTLPCGRDSITISVNSCTSTSVCRNANGTLTVSGGTGPYTWSVWDSTGQTCVGGIVILGICTGTWEPIYGWTTFATGATATPPAPVATDTIKVVDNAGTTITINNVSTVPPCNACNLTATIAPTNPGCAGNNGSVTANVTAGTGTAPYHYRWSPAPADTFATLGSLSAGTYTVTVTDANGCTTTATSTLAVSGTLALTTSSTPASCGNSNGSATVTVTGGSGTYVYTWSVAGSTATLNNLPAGNYTVTVTQNGCSGVTSVSVSSSNGVSASLGPKTDVKCFGAGTGIAHITATGGTLPYTYTWSAPAVSTVDSATGLIAGSYTVTVRDANNCTSLVTFAIAQPSAALAATDSTKPAYCGNNNGKIYIVPSGGTAAYTYTWSPNVSSTDSATGLAVNTYLVTVTDANQCTTSLSVNVVAAAGPTLSLLSKNNVTCSGGNNGKIVTTLTGGTGPFTYTWSPNVSTSDSATGLTQGNYTVVVHDANNCTSSLSATISQPAAMSISTTTLQANCGVSDGSATATVTGGTSPFTYQWSVGTSTTAVDSGLPAGSYSVIVTDSNHCTATGTAAISNFGAPTATITNQTNESCNGGNTGKIVLNVTGGTQPYTYTWSPNVSTVDSAVALSMGTYNVTVHDATSCIAVISATITQPGALAASVLSANANCGQTDGWAKINVSGGTGSYTYAWTGTAQTTDSITGLAGGTYHVTVTDSLGCTLADSVIVGTNNGPTAPTISASGPLTFCQGGSVVLTSSVPTGNTWSNAATTQSITVSASGTYTVTQTVGSCTSPPSASVVVTVNPTPAAPTITASGPLAFCPGDSVILTSSAASGNLWSDGETTQSITVKAGGTYTVSDTQNTCPSPASAAQSVTINPAPQPVITANKPAICPGATVTLDATTSSATSYLWNTTATQPSITVSTPGLYQVAVTVNGCLGTDTMTIYSQPLLGALPVLMDSAICQGDFITIDATTVNATSYVWTGPVSQSTPAVTVDSQGVYLITVTNSCGSESGSVTISFKDCECKIVMPNAFTPNGDQVNDAYGPDFKCDNPKYLSMRIFNRWGEKVFETTDLAGQWDGKFRGTMQPPGVYIYYIEFTGLQNNVEKTVKLMGSVTLIR